MPKPFFSIVLPTKDRAFLLKPLIESILAQDFRDFEFIVVDNSDNDQIQDLLSQFDEITNYRTGGLNMADNWDKAISLAQGKFMILISDKILLKKGALKYLHNFHKNSNAQCVTWGIDIFCDEEKILFKDSSKHQSSKISSDRLMTDILASDYPSYDCAPFHCNSSISLKLINDIRSKHGRISYQLNPDYTLSYQITLSLKNIYRLNKSLTILRQKNLEIGYGNGFSFVRKTETAKQFMKDNNDWIIRTGEIQEIPIHGNHFIIDIMLKDLYEILKIFKINPDKYLNLQDRILFYYLRTLDEIYWRISMGVDMSNEILLWNDSLKTQTNEIQQKVKKYKYSRRYRNARIHFNNFIKSIPVVSILIIAIRDFLKKLNGKKFNSIQKLLHETKIEA